MTVVFLPDGAAEWLRHGERGASSEAIFVHLSGLAISRGMITLTPADSGDLRRCRLLLEQVPAFRAKLHRMAEVSRSWAALVACWDEVCAVMDAECPNWRHRPTGVLRTASRTDEFLRKLEESF